jgi:hypothetical protein
MTTMAAKAVIMDQQMDAVSAERPYASTTARVLRGLRPTAPAALGAFAVAFVAALLMPMAWLSAICWNLYLDTIHTIFMEPLGNATRIGVGLGFGVIAVLIAAAVVLALATPAGQDWLARFRRPAAADDFSEFAADADKAPTFARRRSADIHPDAPPVAPINALRDLPASGLGPVALDVPANDAADNIAVPVAEIADDDALDLVEFADEPVIDAVEMVADENTDALPEVVDTSLGAMVARLEAGLVRQRDTAADSNAEPAPTIDFALEAALSTLQRMNKAAVG